jgi:CBS domain containing-hemolysin-like protein
VVKGWWNYNIAAAVYKEDLDEVAGIIHTKDLLPHLDMPDDFDWHLNASAYFIHEQKMMKTCCRSFVQRESTLQ